MRLYITGFPGTGKTALADALASKLAVSWVDLDMFIESTEGRDILSIFEKNGEAFFRELEAEALRKASAAIIATGGGVVMSEENLCYMRARGKILLLVTTPEEIERRLSFGYVRPLLGGGIAQIKKLLFARAYAYNNADYVLNTTGCSLEEAAAAAEAILCSANLLSDIKGSQQRPKFM